MKNVNFAICCVLGSVLFFPSFAVCASDSLMVKIGEQVPNFVLEGADGNQYELEKMNGKVIILIMGSRKTSENNDRWVKMLQQTFPKDDSLEIFLVFDMRGIPFFISKGFVRGKVKEKQKEHPVTILMDWGQKVNKLLGADKDKTDIFAIDPGGVLVSHQVGTYSEKKLRLLRGKIVEILESDSLKEKETEESDSSEEKESDE